MILRCFALAPGRGPAFVGIERRSADPTVTLGPFSERVSGGGLLALMMRGFGLFGVYFFTALYLQDVLGFSPTRTGLAFLPMGTADGGEAVLSEQLPRRFGAHRLVASAMVLMAAGIASVSLLSAHPTFLDLMPSFAVAGIGGGLTVGRCEASGDPCLPVRGSKAVHRVVGVQTAGIGHHPQLGPAQQPGLPARQCLSVRESQAIGGDAENRHHLRPDAFDQRGQLHRTRGELGRFQLVGPGGGPGDQIGDAQTAVQQMRPVGGPIPLRGIDVPVDQPGPVQGGVEAVATPGEVSLHGRGQQPRIDPHEQQFHPRPQQIGQGGPVEPFQLSPGESTHQRAARAVATRVTEANPAAARRLWRSHVTIAELLIRSW